MIEKQCYQSIYMSINVFLKLWKTDSFFDSIRGVSEGCQRWATEQDPRHVRARFFYLHVYISLSLMYAHENIYHIIIHLF